MVSFTVVCAPLVLQDEPVMLPVGGGLVGGGFVGGGFVGGGVLLPEGTEHSLTDLLGIGSEPNVATVQVNVPFSTLKTNAPDAPNATLVGALTEQESGILQIVVYPSGRLAAENAGAAITTSTAPASSFRNIPVTPFMYAASVC
jgi:hypothetical protein